MNDKKTKCYDCDKELEPHEVKTYSERSWKYGRDYYDLCKSCYKERDKRDKKWLIFLVLFYIFALFFMVFFAKLIFWLERRN
ncbi:hypothetical protein [endosymbiont DhMRE of Dentiscutata heterogama]|uniref:hypothetical protein n=1 Tax=endosymbiont DhMRE of Dentiscutata heterogama TaxID=1609546 RepID=UPI002AD205D2|nr:hypothetical protein [endosymbiont DhMRE of Dentiscutata heterogama]